MFGKQLFHGFTRLLWREKTHALGEEKTNGKRVPKHVLVEDCGADTTLFFFSGLARRLGGVSIFEFRRLLKDSGQPFNLVFFRDVHSMAYQLQPDGAPGGMEFYEKSILRVRERLGASYNVILGASSGGFAAFIYGARCQMDRIIAFGPVLDHREWVEPRKRWANYLDYKKLLRSPVDYAEVALVTYVANGLFKDIERQAGPLPVGADVYRNVPSPRPQATIFYGANCQPDVRQAERLAHLPEVELRPVPTGRHGCPMVLRKRGELGGALLEEIRKGPTPASESVRARRGGQGR